MSNRDMDERFAEVEISTAFMALGESRFKRRPTIRLDQRTLFNHKKGITVVLLSGGVYSGLLDSEMALKGKGVAKCSPNDVFDERTGFNVAFNRALANLFSNYADDLAKLV